jgi:hypothetical protein
MRRIMGSPPEEAAMVEVLIFLLLLLALDVAAVLWGADSRGLDAGERPRPGLATPRSARR